MTKYTYDYPRPAVTVDIVVFGLADEGLRVLLIQRDLEPFRGTWALPGGFVNMDEELEDAARRELEEETGLTDVFVEQLFTFGGIDRDPRTRVISVAYYALVNIREHVLHAHTDARRARWFDSHDVPELAFDHVDILEAARTRLRGKVRYQPIGFELLPTKFTLSQLRRLYELILERSLDKRNFRKKILSTGLVVSTNERQTGVAHRAARLYRFDRERYHAMTRRGFEFAI